MGAEEPQSQWNARVSHQLCLPGVGSALSTDAPTSSAVQSQASDQPDWCQARDVSRLPLQSQPWLEGAKSGYKELSGSRSLATGRNLGDRRAANMAGSSRGPGPWRGRAQAAQGCKGHIGWQVLVGAAQCRQCWRQCAVQEQQLHVCRQSCLGSCPEVPGAGSHPAGHVRY